MGPPEGDAINKQYLLHNFGNPALGLARLGSNPSLATSQLHDFEQMKHCSKPQFPHLQMEVITPTSRTGGEDEMTSCL